MKHATLVLLALIIAVSANAGDMKRRYMMSNGIDSSMVIHINGKSVFKNPQMMFVSFYDNGCDTCATPRNPVMLVNEVVVTNYVDEFDATVEKSCNEFDKWYGTGYCLVFHRDVPVETPDFRNFRLQGVDTMNTVLKCTEAEKCKMYIKH